MWYVIGLIWLALIAGIVWAHRSKRKKHDTARAKQLEALLSDARLSLTTGAATDAAPQVAAAKIDAPPVPEFGKKQRLLPQTEAVLYYVFRAGLPDHEIFANLALADLVELAPSIRGYDREQKLRRLEQLRLDLVICSRKLDVIAVVSIRRNSVPDAALAANTRFVEQCLKTAGIPLVSIDAATPPRHHEVRTLVYGSPG